MGFAEDNDEELDGIITPTSRKVYRNNRRYKR